MRKSVLLMIFIAVITAKAQLLTEEEVAKIKEIHNKCLETTSVDISLEQKILNTGEYTDDEKLKEHIFCCLKGLGFQNESGEIMQDVMVKKFTAKFPNEAMVKSVVEKCAQKKDTPVETAFEMSKCLHTFAPKDMDIGAFLF